MAALAVALRGLAKRYHGADRNAVDGIDIETSEGEYLVLLGPSGCGKTTLLRTIAGLEEATDGDVLIGGNVVNGLPPRARQVAMVFQSYALYPHKSVLQNIAFPLKAEKIDKAEREKKSRWAAGLLGIEPLLDRKPRPPRELWGPPADPFVPPFPGSPPMNLVKRDGHLVGFRPENLLPAEIVSNGSSLTARLSIARIEYLSGDRHVYGMLHGLGEETRVIARLPATVTVPLEDGDEREFAIHERDLRFFDAESGKQTAPQPVRA